MKITALGLTVLVGLVHTGFAQPDTSRNVLKFSQYMDLVGKHNLDYAAEQFEVSKSEAAIEIAKVFADPTLSFGASQDKEGQVTTGHGLSTGIDATIDLFGKRRARIDLARSEHELSKALLADFFRNLEADAASSFLDALKQKQLFAVKVSSWQTMKRLAEADSLRLKLGSIMEIDATQSKLEAGSLYNELVQADADLQNSYLQLSQMTGSFKGDSGCVPEGSLMVKPRSFLLSNLLEIARNNRADLVAALYNKEVAKKALKVAKKERNIDLGVSLGMGNSYSSPHTGPAASTVSAGISIPLKFSNRYKGDLKQAQYQLSQNEVLYEKAELQICTEVAEALQRYQSLCKQVDTFDQRLLEGAQSVRKGKIYSYSRGETSLLEVLNAQRTYNDIQERYYETLYNRAVALVDLERAAGIWDVSF